MFRVFRQRQAPAGVPMLGPSTRSTMLSGVLRRGSRSLPLAAASAGGHGRQYAGTARLPSAAFASCREQRPLGARPAARVRLSRRASGWISECPHDTRSCMCFARRVHRCEFRHLPILFLSGGLTVQSPAMHWLRKRVSARCPWRAHAGDAQGRDGSGCQRESVFARQHTGAL